MGPILTKKQKLALELIAQTSLAQEFYFSGGTALAYYYLKHRRSEDLDFFSQKEFDPQSVFVNLKSFQTSLGYISIDFQQSFNRNLFFLRFAHNYVLKLEFTFYPFSQVEQPMLKDGLLIDSALDIAVNKLFTISQKPRGRDYFDLYFLVKKYHFNLKNLRMLAKQKFDWHVDPLQLATRFYEVDEHLDDPIILKQLKENELTNFFKLQARSMKKEIVSGARGGI